MQNSFIDCLLNKPDILGIMIPIIAIVALATIVIIKLLIRHRERMTMIERGMHPDFPPEDVEKENTKGR
jgi:hypothetical protein